MQAAIYGFAGTELTADEKAFFRDCSPAGYILFRRNIETRSQLKALTDSIRDLEGRDDVAILIDQEGGRVARMRPPEWPAVPAAEAFDKLYQVGPSSAIEAARVNARALGLMLAECGVTVDCLPMLDVRQQGATDIVGDRALGYEPMQVSALGKAQLDGLASAGIVGVVKHMPGHGRALVDSHHELPFVDASDAELAIDLEPFERLRGAPQGLVAHHVVKRLGPGQPGQPVTDRDPRHHPRPDRLRRLPDDRRQQHGRIVGLAGRTGGKVRCRGLRRGAAVQRGAGRQYRRRARGARPDAGRRGAAGAGDGDCFHSGRRHRLRRGAGQARRAAGAGLTLRLASAAMGEFEFETTAALAGDDALTLNLDGWEGPLDLLLSLARAQKVDLRQISILALVDQYIAYIAEARDLKLEIAADYLVMAAWLTYLKSGLLLPKDPEVDPSPEELAWRLQQRLMRLDAMREAGARLMGRDRIGRDVFVFAAPAGLRTVRKAAWQVTPFELFAAYGRVRARTQPAMHVVAHRAVMTLEDAIHRVSMLLGQALDWTTLEAFLPATGDPAYRKSALASSFLAALELARQGKLEIEQAEPFADIMVRAA